MPLPGKFSGDAHDGFASKQEVLEKKTTNVFLPYICRSVYCSHFRGLEPHPRLFANETTNLLENTVKQRRDAIWREDSANICSELEKCSIPLASTASSFRNCWLAIVTLPNIVVLFPWQRSGPANTWWSVSSFLNLSKKSFRVTYLLTTSVLEFITTLVTVIVLRTQAFLQSSEDTSVWKLLWVVVITLTRSWCAVAVLLCRRA